MATKNNLALNPAATVATEAIDGYVHPAFSSVAQTMSTMLNKYEGGASIAVYHRGKCVVDLWGGQRNREGAPWEKDTLALSFSTTKGIASTVVHILADRGLIDYDEKVMSYWPEFGQNGKENITVREVMAHQSGLYHIRQMIDHADQMIDWNYMIKAIEESKPVHEPGTQIGYHGLSYGYLVGEIIRRVTGKSIAEVVAEELAEPMGLDGLYIGTPDIELRRVAELVGDNGGRVPALEFGQALRGPVKNLQSLLNRFGIKIEIASVLDIMPRGISTVDFGADKVLSQSIPSINGTFTARSLARVYAMLAQRGELEGKRYISKETFYRATQLQHPPKGQLWMPFDIKWRLGWHGIGTLNGFLPEAFGHFGFGGSGAWADPSRELSFAIIVNKSGPMFDTRILRVGAAVVKVIDELKKNGHV